MSVRRIGGLALAALLLVATLLAAGCGGGRDAADAADVLHRGLSSDPESLDPQRARSVQSGVVLRDIGEGLMRYSASGELLHGAAESHEVDAAGLTYTFTIRADARWSNGDPVTAEDFAYSLRRLADPATGAAYADLIGNIVNAREIGSGDRLPPALGVEAVDEHTLVVRLVQPTPYILKALAHFATFPVHAGAVAQHGSDFGKPGTRLSNGAYTLEEWSPNSYVQVQRNPHYWNDSATSLDTVRFHVINEEVTQLNRYRAGELHITDSVPPEGFDALRQSMPNQLRVAPYLGVYYYGYNLSRPPFRDSPALREALSLVIDRDLLVKTVTGRGELPAWSWVPPGVPNFDSTRFSYADWSQEERIARARRLYEQAGYGPDKPLRTSIRFNTSATERRIAIAVSGMWREALGVETELVNEEFKVLLDNIMAARLTEVFRGSWIGDYDDAHTFLSIMESGNPINLPGYASKAFDNLMTKAAAATDPTLRQRWLEEAERVLLADHPVIPLYFYVSKHLVQSKVRGWHGNILDYHPSQDLRLAPDESGAH